MSKTSRIISKTKEAIPVSLYPFIRESMGITLSFINKGDQVTCSCCQGKFSSFLPGGVNNRPNAYCPRCGSFERHRLLWLYLQQKTNFFTANLKVLHFAPEYTFQKKFLKMENLDYISADLNSPLASIQADITSIPFEDNTFDVIICNHVLEHIPDDTKAMQELHRVLSKGGTAILQIPQDLNRDTTFEDDSITDPKERAEIFGQYDHLRVYGLDYFQKLRDIGFQVDEIDYTDTMTSAQIEQYRLAKGEIIPVCKK